MKSKKNVSNVIKKKIVFKLLDYWSGMFPKVLISLLVQNKKVGIRVSNGGFFVELQLSTYNIQLIFEKCLRGWFRKPSLVEYLLIIYTYNCVGSLDLYAAPVMQSLNGSRGTWPVYSPVIETVVLSFQQGINPVSSREWFRFKTVVLPFQTGSGTV